MKPVQKNNNWNIHYNLKSNTHHCELIKNSFQFIEIYKYDLCEKLNIFHHY